MPIYTCALTLAGILDVDEAKALSIVIERYCKTPGGPEACLEVLMNGEREFFFTIGFSEEGPWILTGQLRDVLEEYHLSHCLMTIIDGDLGETQVQIIDRELSLEGRFPAHDGIFQTDGFRSDEPALQLTSRWQEIDQAPPLRIIHSKHDALRLAARLNHQWDIEAYMQRRAAA